MKKNYLLLLLFAFGIANTFIYAQDKKEIDPEAYRPLFHFSPASGWMSDPNGMVYYDGEYHLCYQHVPVEPYPFGGTHWGHAVSKDLLHWEHLPIALSPDSLGAIFSGGSIVDVNNTSGLGTKENPPLIAFFTYHNGALKETEQESQALAYSLDKGRTWTKYAHNPVIANPGIKDFRDPKVIWDAKNKQWLMALTSGPTISFYSSQNCIDWEYLSKFGEEYGSHVGPWECPDFFPMKVKGTNETKWVLIVSVVDFTETPNRLATSTQYFVGDFDGINFTTNQKDTLWIDYGKDCYAGVTFADAPNDRKIFVAWMQSHQYGGNARGAITKSWAGAATFPREINVVKKKDTYRLSMNPVKEIANLYQKQTKLSKQKIDGRLDISDKMPSSFVPIELNLDFSADKLPVKYGIKLKNDQGEYISFAYDREKEEFIVDRTNATTVKFHDRFACIQQAPYSLDKKDMQWKLLLDTSSAELYVGDNQVVFSNVVYPTTPFNSFEIFAEGGTVLLKGGTVIEFK